MCVFRQNWPYLGNGKRYGQGYYQSLKMAYSFSDKMKILLIFNDLKDQYALLWLNGKR